MISKKVPFTSLLSSIVDNRGKTCPTTKKGIPLIATNCVKNINIYPSYEKVRFVSKETYDSWFRAHPKPGDLIFVTKGSPGEVCLAPDPVDFCIAQDMVAIRADESIVYPNYLFAALRAKQTQKDILSLHVGTMIPHFKKGDFDKLLIPLPDYSIQKSIGDFYKAISLKIENNHRMNKTLEEIARTIFKSWFVDFDPVHAKVAGKAPAHMDAETASLFPSLFGEDSLPMGWKLSKLGEHISFTKGRSYKSAELKESDTALVTLKSFLRGGGYRSDGLKPYIGTYKDEQILKSGDLIVALTDVTRAADVIGKPAIVRSNDKFNRLIASLDVGIIRPVSNLLSIQFLYCMMRTHDFQSHIYGHTSGTTVLHLSKDGLPNYEFAMPSKELLEKFKDIAKPIFSKIEFNEKNSITLTKLRDTLLPKLMSGEIFFKDVKSEVEAVV